MRVVCRVFCRDEMVRASFALLREGEMVHRAHIVAQESLLLSILHSLSSLWGQSSAIRQVVEEQERQVFGRSGRRHRAIAEWQPPAPRGEGGWEGGSEAEQLVYLQSASNIGPL